MEAAAQSCNHTQEELTHNPDLPVLHIPLTFFTWFRTPGHLVSRDEIMGSVWRDAAVSYNSLTP